MDNMRIYNALRSAPDSALRPIQAGRLKGKSDINPMWRIKALTEHFGPCGVGWKYELERLWLEPGAAGEAAAFAQIGLYIREGEEWSEKIPGIGGSMLIAKEKNGMYTNDECYKMALTDALSVACKALGAAADVYWDKDPTKYDRPPEGSASPADGGAARCELCGDAIQPLRTKDAQYTADEVADRIRRKYGRVICKKCQRAAKDQEGKE